MPEPVVKAIIDMNDRFDRFEPVPDTEISQEVLDDSCLYLSSNWSAEISITTNYQGYHKNILNRLNIPKLDM